MIERHLEERQRDRRQDQRLQAALGEEARRPPAEGDRVAAAERRQPAEEDGEDQDQQDADQERRQADADERGRQQELREPSGPSQRGVDAERNADRERQDRGGRRELEGGGKPLLEQRRHRAALPQRPAEIALHRVADEPGELHDERLVEAELRAKARLVLDGRVLADHEVDRVAGEIEEPERDERDHRHDGGRLQHAAKDEGEHGVRQKVWFNTVPGILAFPHREPGGQRPWPQSCDGPSHDAALPAEPCQLSSSRPSSA